MFFKFNSSTGRINRTSVGGAYNPEGLKPETEGGRDFAWAINTQKAVADSPAASSAALANAKGIIPSESGYQNIVRLQHHFAKQDGLFVWQKMGARDKGPYLLTMGLMVVGTLYAFKTLWTMSWPRENKD